MTVDTLQKAVDKAIKDENDHFIAWEKAHPDACPNCMTEGGDNCWLCDGKAEWNQPRKENP